MALDRRRTVRRTWDPHEDRADVCQGADLVTQYDRAVENMISTSLKEKYPNYESVPPALGQSCLGC